MTPSLTPEPRIRDLAEVTPAETVVRLDRASGRLEELVLTGDVSRSLGAVLESARGSTGAGFLVVGHYGSGKSHFLAAVGELLAEPVRAGALSEWDSRTRGLAASARRSLVVSVPLVDYRAEAALEDVVWQRAWLALGRPARPPSTDRAAAWSGLLEAAGEEGHPGLLLLLDELSEFLRAKRGAVLTEDLRFLQFLGEWARRAPVVVLGALQESIEEVANVSQKELARIRDRYPTTLGLSMRNVEDLVRGRLVRLKPGAEEVVLRAHRELKAAFPRWRVTPERFLRCYPIHPETLTLLDGLRFLLSQQRGVVDFICRQLRGDEAAGVAAWQDRPYRELIAPDRVYDHFRSRLGERVETSRLAETVVPYYERAAAVLFSSDPDRELAVRAVKVLTLLSASPLERRRDASELAEMLLVRVSALDPNANYSYLKQAVLDVLAGHGAYVVARPERGGPVTFAVELEADASVTAGVRAAQVRAELRPGDRRVIDGLAELGSTPTLPLPHLKQLGRHRRELIWQNTLRHVVVAVGRLPELEHSDIDELQGSLDSLGADVCLLVAEPEEADQRTLMERAAKLVAPSPRVAVWVPDRLSQAELEFALDTFSKRVVLDRARSEGGGPAGLADHLERSLEMAVARAREVLARCYFQGALVAPGDAGADLPSLSGLPFDRLLRSLLGPVLAALHPRHQEVQPYDELVGDRLVRRLLEGVLAAPRITVSAAERQQLKQLIESYLVPLGLLRRRGDAYLVAPDPVRSPAVAELLRLASAHGGIATGQAARELAKGAVGLSDPETLLLLNASVQSGLLEASKRGKQVSAPFFSLSELDRVSAGELVAAPLRARIAELGPIFGQGPFEPWNARLQQTAWEHAGAWLETRRQEAAQVREAIARLAELPPFSEADPGALGIDLELVGAVFESVDPLASPREGIESVLRAVPETEALLAAASRLGRVARFARSDLGALNSALAYLTHPDLFIPEGPEYARLEELRGEALEMAGDVLQLAAEDKTGEIFSAYDQFRRTFAAVYEEAHASFYGGEGSRAAAIVTSSPEYRALAALSDVGAVAVLDDRVKVDRAVTAATLKPCQRRVEAELQWRPSCACAFRLGDLPPVLDAEALVATAARGVEQHLAEIVRAENRERLEQAAEDLASLERTEVAAELRSLLELAAAPAEADPVAITHLLAGSLRETLRDILGGSRFVVRRDLAQLREDLIGRRYPRRRLLEVLRGWVGEEPEVPEAAFIEVFDSEEEAPRARQDPRSEEGGVVGFLRRRYPTVAVALGAERPADTFWLAAWWLGGPVGGRSSRPEAPAWIPRSLLEQGDLLADACRAALEDPSSVDDLRQLDARVGPRTLLGEQISAALDLGQHGGLEVADELFSERLLRHPLRLAATELVFRLAGDWQLAERLPGEGLEALRAGHVLLEPGELNNLDDLLGAARRLARLERALGPVSCQVLVEEIYPECCAPVPDLISRAQLGAARGGLVAGGGIAAFEAAANRLLRSADGAFRDAAAAGFPGCLRIWEVGEVTVAPLLRAHPRVAVLLVDAMRADLWLRLRQSLQEMLPGRRMTERWAVVPEPTRTAEAVAALYLGHPVPAGGAPEQPPPPFGHLGYESRAMMAADRDVGFDELLEFWSHGPPLAVAVAGGVDERLHRSPVELAGFLEDAAAGLSRRLLASLRALPADVPLVILADHGFRENPGWGRGREGRYGHGGPSLEESVVPVVVFQTPD